MANPYVFNLTDAEALDVLFKLPPLCSDYDYLFTVYATLLAQYNALPSFVSSQTLGFRLTTEDGDNLITENSN